MYFGRVLQCVRPFMQVLDVRYCQLKEIPDSLCDLQENLVTVHFDYNFILSFPKPIGRLKGLRNLNLSKNEIKTVPIGCIEYMTGLQKLDLSQNWLTDIPSTIGINQVFILLCFALIAGNKGSMCYCSTSPLQYSKDSFTFVASDFFLS